jgi:regulator of replication initiation timing
MAVGKTRDDVHPSTELFDNDHIEKIHDFATRVTSVENRIVTVLDAHLNDLRRLIEENKALRINLANLNSRISLIDEDNFISKTALNDINERLQEIKAALNLEKKNAKILKINYEYLPVENAKLKEEKFKLIKELECLRLILKEQYLKRKVI